MNFFALWLALEPIECQYNDKKGGAGMDDMMVRIRQSVGHIGIAA